MNPDCVTHSHVTLKGKLFIICVIQMRKGRLSKVRDSCGSHSHQVAGLDLTFTVMSLLLPWRWKPLPWGEPWGLPPVGWASILAAPVVGGGETKG